MKKMLLCFLLLSLTAFSEEKQAAPPPAKKHKPHFAGVRRGASNKFKQRLGHLAKVKKESTASESDRNNH
jgi:hypothetical protein